MSRLVVTPTLKLKIHSLAVFLPHERGSFSHNGPHNGITKLDLSFTLRELNSYIEYRKTELTKKSQDWIERAAKALWHYANGIVNKNNLDALRADTLDKYQCEDSKSKMLLFAVAFLKYLTKTRLDNHYHVFFYFS